VLLETTDHQQLGRLLNHHQEQLSENLQVSLPPIDGWIAEALRHGALGGKINGSGCGGSFFLYCPGKTEELVGLFRGKGLRAWPVTVGEGLQIQSETVSH